MTQQTAKLKLYLLGNVAIYFDGELVADLPSRAAEALLIYLAFQPLPMSRELLAELLWQDRPTKQSLANLRSILSSLRKRLPDVLEITRQTVAFNHAADVWIDSAEFETLTQKNTDEAAAIDLYRGDFLTGFYLREAPEFETWSLIRREQLRLLAIEMMERQLNTFIAQGNLQQGLKIGQQLLTIDPLRESVYESLMWLHMRSGQRTAALKFYRQCEAILQAELGVEPSESLQTLFARFRQTMIPPKTKLLALTHQLFGREQELATLSTLLDRHERLITLLGSGGMGKTTLAHQAATKIAARPHKRFLDGIFFVPLAEIQASAALPIAIAEVLELQLLAQGNVARQLIQYLKSRELLLILDNFEHLLHGGHRFILELMAHAPHISVLITSRSSLNLQQERIVRLQGLPVVDEHESNRDRLLANPSIGLFFARLGHDAQAASVETLQAVRDISRLLLGLPLGLELAAAQASISGSKHLLAHLQAGFDVLDTTRVDLPDRHRSLRIVFEQSFDLLAVEVREALLKLSIYPATFSFAAAQNILGEKASELIGILVTQTLVQQHEAAYFSLHPLLQQFAREQLEAQAMLQADVEQQVVARFVQLCSRGEIDSAEVEPIIQFTPLLFRHHTFESIDQIVEFTTMITAFLKQHLRLIAAAKVADQAAALIEVSEGRLPHAKEAVAQAGLYKLCADFHSLSNDYAQELAFLQLGAQTLGERIAQSEPRAKILAELAKQATHRMQPPKQAPLEKHAQLQLACNLLEQLSMHHFSQNERPQAVYYALRSLNISETLPISGLRARAYARVCTGLAAQGRHRQASAYQTLARETLQTMSALVAPDQLADDAAYVARIAAVYDLNCGRFHAAQNALEQSIKYCDAEGDYTGWADSFILYCMPFTARGQFPQGLAHYTTFYERAVRHQHQLYECWGIMGRGVMLLLMGDTAKAVGLLTNALTIAEQLGHEQAQMTSLGYLSLGQLRSGDLRQAYANATRCLTIIANRTSTFYTMMPALGHVATVFVAGLDSAEIDQSQLATLQKQTLTLLKNGVNTFPYAASVASYHAGLHAAAIGQIKQARQLFKQACLEADEMETTFVKGMARFELARLPNTTYETKTAHLREAEAIFAKCNMRYELRNVHDLRATFS